MNNEIFTPILSVGLNKVAIVVGQEFIPQLGIEQTMEGQEGAKFLSKYFDSVEEAET